MSVSTLIEPVEGPFVWRGDELSRSQDWLYRLSADEIAELEAVGRRFVADDPDLRTVSADDYPLPVCAEALARFAADLDRGRGFVLVRGLPIERYGDTLAGAIFYLMGLHLGEPIQQNELGDVIDHIMATSDKTWDDPDSLPSRIRDALPFHSDSSDVVGLLCLRPARAGGASRLVSGATLFNEVVRRRPDLAGLLREPWYWAWRRQDPQAPADWYTSPIVSWTEGVFSMYAGSTMIEAAQAYPDVPRLTDAQREVLALLDEIAQEPGVALDMDFQPGDIQWLLNYAALHSRTEFVDHPEVSRRRHLLRLWLRRDVGRPLVPNFGKHQALDRRSVRSSGAAGGGAGSAARNDQGKFRIAEAVRPRMDWGA